MENASKVSEVSTVSTVKPVNTDLKGTTPSVAVHAATVETETAKVERLAHELHVATVEGFRVTAFKLGAEIARMNAIEKAVRLASHESTVKQLVLNLRKVLEFPGMTVAYLSDNYNPIFFKGIDRSGRVCVGKFAYTEKNGVSENGNVICGVSNNGLSLKPFTLCVNGSLFAAIAENNKITSIVPSDRDAYRVLDVTTTKYLDQAIGEHIRNEIAGAKNTAELNRTVTAVRRNYGKVISYNRASKVAEFKTK